MDKVHTILPRFDGELLPGSFAVVAHTVTSYRKTNQGVVVGETANLNVQWVLLLGSPDQPRPARVALSDNDGKSVHGQGLDDNGEGGGEANRGTNGRHLPLLRAMLRPATFWAMCDWPCMPYIRAFVLYLYFWHRMINNDYKTWLQ